MRFVLGFLIMVSTIFGFDTSIFPKTENGEKQVILTLKSLENEDEYLVKVFFGKEMMLDCNAHSFMGLNLERKILQGYGYEYFKLSGRDDIASTMMLCSEPKKLSFLSFDPNFIVRYNSNYPLIFYVPIDFSVKYEVFKKVESKILD